MSETTEFPGSITAAGELRLRRNFGEMMGKKGRPSEKWPYQVDLAGEGGSG